MLEQIIEFGVQMHLAGLLLLNTDSILKRRVTNRFEPPFIIGTKSRITADQRCTTDHIAVVEITIQVNDERRWLYAAINSKTNKFLHLQLFPTKTTQLTVLFLQEL